MASLTKEIPKGNIRTEQEIRRTKRIAKRQQQEEERNIGRKNWKPNEYIKEE